PADKPEAADKPGAPDKREAPADKPADADADADTNSKPSPGPAAAAAPAATAVDTTPWLKENPLPSTLAVLQRGRERFEIYCAVCHGNDGSGNGLVNRRAQRLLSSAWVQPSSIHQDTLYADQYADGKLFNTISNGIRKMPGYAAQISTRDRWAVVAYVRALQASQNATLEDLPADKRNEIKSQQSEVMNRLKEQAEQEKKRAEQAAKKS
ncbi:MAG: c-type cytochrome, partial [Planctomycetaceae bacterium]